MEDKPIVRRRVNVSTSVKGIRTTDATFEITGDVGEREYWDMFNVFMDAVDVAFPPPPLDLKK